MKIGDMRLYVMQAYPGPRWAQRVSKMSDNQVIAIYSSIREREERRKLHPEDKKTDDNYRQLTLWEVFDI